MPESQFGQQARGRIVAGARDAAQREVQSSRREASHRTRVCRMVMPEPPLARAGSGRSRGVCEI